MHVVYLLQDVDNHYGIDWGGPVTIDNNSVDVIDPTAILSCAEKDLLNQYIPYSEVLTEEWMVHAFTIVHSANAQ